MVQAPAEVAETEAEGRIKSIYGDIKATLRLSAVDPAFLALATHPDFLVTAWTVLKPNAQIVYFERQADMLRRAAVEGVRSLGQPPVADDATTPVIRALLYAQPKVFLALSALRIASAGALPTMQRLPADDKRQIVTGVPEGMAQVTYGATDAVPDDVAAGSEFRAFAGNPTYVQTAWSALQPVLDQATYRQAQRTLRLLAEAAITALPYRMDIYPHVLRQSGLTEHEIDAVHGLLATLCARAARSVVNTALLAGGVLGWEAAAQSPFPTELQ